MEAEKKIYLYPDLLGAEVIDLKDKWGLMYRFSIPNPTGEKPKSWDTNLNEALTNNEDYVYGDLSEDEYTPQINEFENITNTDGIFLSVGYHYHIGSLNRSSNCNQMPEIYCGGFFIELAKGVKKDPELKKWVFETMAGLAVSYAEKHT